MQVWEDSQKICIYLNKTTDNTHQDLYVEKQFDR